MSGTGIGLIRLGFSVGALTAFIGATTLTLAPLNSAHAATCYVDDRGRIVTRRRPGFTRIECPTPEQPAATPQATPPQTDQPTDGTSTTTTAPTTAAPTSAPVAPPPARLLPPSNSSEVFFQESRPDAVQSISPGTNPEAPDATTLTNPVQSPSNSQLYRLPSRRQGLEDDTRVTSRPRVRQRNAASPIPRPKLGDYPESVVIRDRWRIVDDLGYKESKLDPYNRNPYKADKPIFDDWFYSVAVTSDSFYETRDLPTPVGNQSTDDPGSIDVFGGSAQAFGAQILAAEFVYYQGDTVFRPPDHEFRFTPVFNYNHTILDEITGINARPSEGETRDDQHLGIQALFYDRHLRNVSDRYDFDSFRIGIQPFSSDFRGFLFQDQQFGARLFGIRDNNKVQYNLAWFRRIEKDTNSGLNDIGKGLRDDDVFIANVYKQDWPALGFISQASVIYNRNRENGTFYYDENDFIQRPASLGRETPRKYDVVYLGYNGDGHFGRLNLTASTYYAIGSGSPGVFVPGEVDIRAAFAAFEVSMDFDWIRPRLSFMYASGDDDPFDDVATGFDTIFENPQFAGGETTFWNRQAVPLVAGGRVALSGRNSLMNSLRASREEGQSNFTNPGLILAGAGVDLDFTPRLRLSLNLNSLYFDNTAVLEAARNQADIDTEIGFDLSASLIYRPLMSQNVVLRASYAQLIAGAGFDDLFPGEDSGYLLLNATLNY